MRHLRFKFTIRRMMVAVAVVAAICGLGIDSLRQGHFRGRAALHSIRANPLLPPGETREPSVRERLTRTYHGVMGKSFNRIADLLGESEREDPFPGRTVEEILQSIEVSSGCVFPP